MSSTAVLDALDALVAGDTTAAAAAAAQDSSLLAAALTRFLAGGPTGSVYEQPAAFEAFIRGGGNTLLYREVSAALAGLYDRHTPASLLDVGCGDGMALVPALAAAAHRPARLTMLEPSAALLAKAEQAVRQDHPEIAVQTWPDGAEPFAATNTTSFDLVESTFALHAIPHERRTRLLETLRPRIGRLALAEFDVPDEPHGGPAHLRFLAETYERGLAEYRADRDLVAQGFLMPVLVGQLTPGARRATWEQPATGWCDQLERAGYRDVTLAPLCDYWSSPAFLLTAHGDA